MNADETIRHSLSARSLEFHHDDPFGKGGDRSLVNIRLLCKTHNLYLAERDYGKNVIDGFRRSMSNDRVSEPPPVYSVWTE